ncbi:MAG: hypothetical protein AAB558_02800 [Patescibacteria group bacterium]
MRIRFFFSGLVLTIFGVLGVTQFAFAAAWPASTTATQIYSSSTIEPSGVAWHPRLERLFFVGDGGQVFKLKADGTVESTWTPGGDLEGITLVDPSSNYVYLAKEQPSDSILEFDISTGQLTGKVWNLSSYMISGVDASHQDANLGMEGLTFVPNGKHPYASSNSGGVFYTGLQYDGKMYMFDVNLSSSGQFTYLGSITPVSGRAYISDLYYSAYTNTVYALFGSTLREMRPDGSYLAEYTGLSGTRQEGFALIESACPATSATAVVAEDTPGAIKLYASYPVNTTSSQYTFYADLDGDGLGSDTTTTLCTSTAPSGYVTNSTDLNDSDYDNDGVSTSADCNDADATISTKQTYYLDADGDGLGSDTIISICSYTTPSGYVTNSDDLNDADYYNLLDVDRDGVSSLLDCNDADASISSNQTYYLDADKDGLGSDTFVAICSYTLPAGYVTNSDDLNDSDYDNDGVSTANDCNDADATQTTGTTYYQDLDGDGLGSSVTTTSCSNSAPAGYVTNSNESSNANDLIPNAGVEIFGDGRDNDGDGEVDEYNDVSTNGYHPYFSQLDPIDPNNADLAATSILGLSGVPNGYIKVKYADNSIYRYRIFTIYTSRNTKVRAVSSTAYLLVIAPSGLRTYVNGYTGNRVSTSLLRK